MLEKLGFGSESQPRYFGSEIQIGHGNRCTPELDLKLAGVEVEVAGDAGSGRFDIEDDGAAAEAWFPRRRRRRGAGSGGGARR